MNPRVFFHARGLSNYLRIVRKYRAIRHSLGERFIKCFEERANHFAQWPDAAPIAVKHYRYFRLRRFPYKVFYQKAADGIIIMTICHTKRDPKLWKSVLR